MVPRGEMLAVVVAFIPGDSGVEFMSGYKVEQLIENCVIMSHKPNLLSGNGFCCNPIVPESVRLFTSQFLIGHY